MEFEVQKNEKEEQKGRKRPVRTKVWKDNNRKLLKNRGEGYESRDGTKRDPIKFRKVTACCKDGCFKKFSTDDQKYIFNRFWDLADKSKQDAFLARCMLFNRPKAHRAECASKPREVVWKYNLLEHGKRTVCRTMLMNTLRIGIKRLKNLQARIKAGDILFEDRRGKHTNRPHRIQPHVWELLKEHLKMFPSRESHYSREKSSRLYFTNPDLNIVKLYRAFQDYYHAVSGESLCIKYTSYYKYFTEHCPYGFILPRTDICNLCFENSKNLNDLETNAAQKLHLMRVEAHKAKKNNLLAETKSSGGETVAVEFDYGQNLPLPKLNVTDQFYKRLLWLNIFNIHVYNDDKSFMYYFLETQSKKNPNSVCSMLNDAFMKLKQQYPQMKRLCLLSDSCGAQNKNFTVMAYLSWLSYTWNISIYHLFPVRGHSYSQCDRNFGLYSKTLKRVETIQTVDEYIDIIKESRTSPEPFEVVNAAPLMKDWTKALNVFFMKKPKLRGMSFKIQKQVQMQYGEKEGVICSSTTYSPLFLKYDFVKKGQKLQNNLNLEKAIHGSIKPEKLKDVKSLAKYLDIGPRNQLENILKDVEKCD